MFFSPVSRLEAHVPGNEIERGCGEKLAGACAVHVVVFLLCLGWVLSFIFLLFMCC